MPAPCEQLWITPFISKYCGGDESWLSDAARGVRATLRSSRARCGGSCPPSPGPTRSPSVATYARKRCAAANVAREPRTCQVVNLRRSAQLHRLVQQRVALRQPAVELRDSLAATACETRTRARQRRQLRTMAAAAHGPDTHATADKRRLLVRPPFTLWCLSFFFFRPPGQPPPPPRADVTF